ncbi:hypothetical protein [Nocardioides sp. zg-1228]|uniref:hypothetical protein n=1 Tax=Nocardioides sp. zg-1228 TaxID=2763008 RepID=UPI00164317DD|nr:hypothetical protein [Nocardioides sp. zg-1228]MBC2932261.1 hypothetical protein [Nocardioides sp. zg-1228]QSF57786.1 hypothetical protein JX575_00645 [Nocardioides sp. zg-1228]
MIRAVRVVVALLFACLGLVVTVQAPAAADCTCKRGQLQQQVERADAVFIGTVDNVEVAGDDHTYDVTASRAYEGLPERSTQVFSAGGKDACGLGELAVGTSYLFLVTGTEAPFEADRCGGTTVANPTKVAKVEALLGEGTSVEPPPPPTAVRTLVEDSPPAGFARTAAPGAAAAIVGLLGLVVVRRLAR